MENEKNLELVEFCGVYCGACTTYRAYNDNDQSLVEWEIRMGMPKERARQKRELKPFCDSSRFPEYR